MDHSERQFINFVAATVAEISVHVLKAASFVFALSVVVIVVAMLVGVSQTLLTQLAFGSVCFGLISLNALFSMTLSLFVVRLTVEDKT